MPIWFCVKTTRSHSKSVSSGTAPSHFWNRKFNSDKYRYVCHPSRENGVHDGRRIRHWEVVSRHLRSEPSVWWFCLKKKVTQSDIEYSERDLWRMRDKKLRTAVHGGLLMITQSLDAASLLAPCTGCIKSQSGKACPFVIITQSENVYIS